MSIRFKVILPYLLLTLIIAVSGAYVVTRLVSSSLDERLSNQLLEAGRVVSDSMVRQEVEQVEAARLIAYTVGLSEALKAGDMDQVSALAGPAAGAQNVENLMVFDVQGLESTHFIRQSDGTFSEVSQRGWAADFPFVSDLLNENNPDSLPKRGLAIDPVDGRYYYFTAIPAVHENEVAGAVVVGTSLNSILPHLKNTSLADVGLYGAGGQSIATTFGGKESMYRQTISIPEEFYQSILNSEGVVEGKNIEADGRGYKLAYGPLEVGDDRLGVFAVILPRDFVVQSGLDTRNNYFLLYSLAAIAVVLIGYLIARLIVNPLSRLVRVSRDIANGDLSRRTEIRTRDEIGVLANTFDEMTENLQQRTLELEKTNRLLEQMDRTKTRFIQVAAHELRTPLTIVQGYAQMIETKSKETDQFTRYSDGILEGTGRMVEIIDNMLDVSRIDTNQLGVMPTKVQIDEVIGKVETTFRPALKDRRLTLTTQGLDAPPPMLGDQDLLYKLFYHIIGNAIKFTPDGGRIFVSGCLIEETAQEPSIEIVIRDSGIGIDPQNHELVFEKFYQTGEVLLHSSGKTKFKGGGPGLGLAIARGIVKAHQGRIWLESPGFNEEKNPGTTVFVRLPVSGHFDELL
ncbi:MAG TPA: ATP-binding protein [Anaerolineales bacterium]|nr:ATP-binding protein [Anaerolineales bacterium]